MKTQDNSTLLNNKLLSTNRQVCWHKPFKKNATQPFLNLLIQMKNNGKAYTTIQFVDKALTHLSKHANLNQPEQVKHFIANKTALIVKEYSLNLHCSLFKMIVISRFSCIFSVYRLLQEAN